MRIKYKEKNKLITLEEAYNEYTNHPDKYPLIGKLEGESVEDFFFSMMRANTYSSLSSFYKVKFAEIELYSAKVPAVLGWNRFCRVAEGYKFYHSLFGGGYIVSTESVLSEDTVNFPKRPMSELQKVVIGTTGDYDSEPMMTLYYKNGAQSQVFNRTILFHEDGTYQMLP